MIKLVLISIYGIHSYLLKQCLFYHYFCFYLKYMNRFKLQNQERRYDMITYTNLRKKMRGRRVLFLFDNISLCLLLVYVQFVIFRRAKSISIFHLLKMIRYLYIVSFFSHMGCTFNKFK